MHSENLRPAAFFAIIGLAIFLPDREGTRLNLEAVRSSYLLFDNHRALAEVIDSVAAKSNLGRLESHKIARAIYAAARCFRIDSAIVQALIEQESMYKISARSFTGAAGLTQFTGIGLSELSYQLGGSASSDFEVSSYWQTKINGCILPWLERGYHLPIYDVSSVRSMKEHLIRDYELSVIYGAILLKTYLAREKMLGPRRSMRQIYLRSLERYNGSSRILTVAGRRQTEKSHYKKSVFRKAEKIAKYRS